MAVRSDFTIDWEVSPRIITIDAPATEVTIQDLYDTCRTLEAEASAMDNASIIEAAGKEELGGGTSVGLTATLQNALVAFEARLGPQYIQCNVSGGNLVAVDDVGTYFTTPVSPTAFTQVVVTASSSATSQNLASMEYSSFNGGVTYDSINGHDGTGYHDGHAIGTSAAPSGNIYDSRIIARERGFTTGFVVNDMDIPLYELDGFTPFEVDGFIFVGSGKDKSHITIPDEALVSSSTYENAHVLGYLDGYNSLYNCLIDNLYYIKGFIEQCVLSPGVIILGGSDTAHFLDCFSGVPGTGTPTIDMGGSGQALTMRNYNGGIKLINKTGPEGVSIDLNSGQIKIDMITVTNGTIVARGVGKLIDANTEDYIASGTYGSLVIVNELVCNPCLSDAIIGYDLIGYSEHGTVGAIQVRSAYNEKIYIDLTNSTGFAESGTVFPTGMENHPVDNIPDMLTLLDNFHLTKVVVNGETVIPASTNLNGIYFISNGSIDRTITIPDTATTNGTKFHNVDVTGTTTGKTEFIDCGIADLSGFRGCMNNCAISGNLDIDDSTGQLTTLNNCRTGGDGAIPSITINGAKLSVIDWSGSLNVEGKTGTSILGISSNDGASFNIKNTCIAGIIILAGIGTSDTETGTTSIVNDESLLNKEIITEEVVTYNGEYHG